MKPTRTHKLEDKAMIPVDERAAEVRAIKTA